MILELLSAVSITPELQFVNEELKYGSPFAWFIFLLLVFFFLSMTVVFIKNMMTKTETIQSNSQRYDFWNSYLKTASLGSIFSAIIMAALGAYQFLIDIAIYPASGFDRAAGPLGESLIYLVMGFGIALIGTIFDFISRWKKTVALQKQ